MAIDRAMSLPIMRPLPSPLLAMCSTLQYVRQSEWMIPEMHAHHNSLHNQQRRGLLNVAVGNTSELSHIRVCVRRVPVAEKIAVSTVSRPSLPRHRGVIE